MKKFFLTAVLLGSFSFTNAAPGTGGYFGHRIIIGGETAVSPFYSVPECFTHFDVQYGAQLGIITCRRMQLNLFYNTYSLAGNDLFDGGEFGSEDRIKGTQYGLSLRNFVKKRGGVAPIGKFIDFSIAYTTNHLQVGANNPMYIEGDNAAFPDVATVTPSIAFGSQGVYWNRIVLGAGCRFGNTFSMGTSSPMMQHLRMKSYFSTFFNAGILL